MYVLTDGNNSSTWFSWLPFCPEFVISCPDLLDDKWKGVMWFCHPQENLPWMTRRKKSTPMPSSLSQNEQIPITFTNSTNESHCRIWTQRQIITEHCVQHCVNSLPFLSSLPHCCSFPSLPTSVSGRLTVIFSMRLTSNMVLGLWIPSILQLKQLAASTGSTGVVWNTSCSSQVFFHC